MESGEAVRGGKACALVCFAHQHSWQQQHCAQQSRSRYARDKCVGLLVFCAAGLPGQMSMALH
jgi:hypothetical protein